MFDFKRFFCSNLILHIKDDLGASSTSIAFVQRGSNGELVEGSCSKLIKVSNDSNWYKLHKILLDHSAWNFNLLHQSVQPQTRLGQRVACWNFLLLLLYEFFIPRFYRLIKRFVSWKPIVVWRIEKWLREEMPSFENQPRDKKSITRACLECH